MEYLPFDPAAIPMLFIYPAISIFVGYLGIKVAKRYIERRSRVAFYLMCGFFAYTITVISLTIGIFSAYSSGYFDYIYRISVPIGYAGATVAAWFFFRFSSTTFWTPSKSVQVTYFIAMISLAAWILFDPIVHDILGLPIQFNYWESPAPENALNLNAVTKLVLLAYNFAVYGIIFYKAHVEAPRSTETARKKIEAIGTGALAMIGFYIMFFIDGVLWIIRNRGFSIFAHLGWIFGFIAAFEFYRGISPK